MLKGASCGCATAPLSGWVCMECEPLDDIYLVIKIRIPLMHMGTNSMTYQSEHRNPKCEGRKKPESRNANSITLVLRQFEFRISFWFRPSDFGFHNNMSPDLRPTTLVLPP